MAFFFDLTVYTSCFFLLVAAVFGILKYRILMGAEKWYLIYLIYTLSIELSVQISVELFDSKDTSISYKFYIGGIFSILSYLFIKKLNLSRSFMLFPLMGILYLIFNWFVENLNHDHAKVLSNVIIFGFAGFSLLQEIRKTSSKNRFLLVDAFLFFYYSISTFIFILHHQLENMSMQNVYIIWGINNILTCFQYLTFIYTFSRLKK